VLWTPGPRDRLSPEGCIGAGLDRPDLLTSDHRSVDLWSFPVLYIIESMMYYTISYYLLLLYSIYYSFIHSYSIIVSFYT
jgi:hypothetical protein